MSNALPPIVDRQTWRAALDELRKREKAATRELDAIAAQRRRLPMVELPDYTLIGADGPIRLVDVFDGRSQLIVYHHMWSDGAEWQRGTRHRRARSAPTWMPRRTEVSRSTCSCATATPSTARGIRTAEAPSSSATPSR
jgi:predicted dithiol-disulfide oxidoreductase (DUF899 family)